MDKRKRLTLQIFASIIISVAMIFISAFYLFNELTIYMDKNKAAIHTTQVNLNNAVSLYTNLHKLIDLKKSPRTASLSQVSEYKNEISKFSGFLSNQEDKTAVNLTKDLTSLASEILNDKALQDTLATKTAEERSEFWVAQQERILTTVNQFIKSSFDSRTIILEKNESNINDAKKITLGLIAICLLIISFVFYKVYQAQSHLRKSADDLKKINEDFKKASSEIENTSWVLERNAKLIEEISGIDESSKISEIVAKHLNTDFPLVALTVYIRKVDSYEFELSTSLGVRKEHLIEEFVYGEGFLGKIVTERNYKVFDIKDFEHIDISSSLIKSLDAKVILYPLIHENHCLGLLEVALNTNEEDLKKYITYLTRATRNIATRVQFGQSHILVEQLLEDSQNQTEELEAQQEELRITNEELIHKTHLLESSEEELRVQQEELSQTNLELNRKAEELEKRNDELNNAQQTVESKIQEVEQASKYKSEFMANMSHELRTPLNSILILAKLLQDNKHKNLNDEQIKYANVIHGAGSDLLELINELLDLAKIESGKIDLNMEKIPTQEFLMTMEDLFKAIAKEKNVQFITEKETNVPEDFFTDEYRVQQVLKNFLSNAFKFTMPGGQVKLNIKTTPENIYFEVSDSGKGISKEKQDLIFEAFRQEDGSTSRKYGGTGLGLSISREIASLLGGRITLTSEPNVGSTFALILPLKIEETTTVDSAQVESILNTFTPRHIPLEKTESIEKVIEINGKNRTILIIEDDVNFADILKGFAENYGFKVLLAHDGAKGIQVAQEVLPSAIILDMMLPISDGWEVLRVLKEDSKTKHIPIHMMSAANFSKKDFIENGAIGFMHKPVTEHTIQKTFENININISQNVKKILLIEDQELQSDYIKNTFAEQNINVIQTFSLENAWKKLNSEQNIDCIILDLHLPDGNGLELIEKIKESEDLIDIPIIINTAYELPKEQYDKILSDARATILKSDKSSDRLIDEVNLFLNKINDSSYKPIKQLDTVVQTGNLNGKKVLIADDDMRNVFALTTTLQSYDMEIEIANNGLEAVEIMKNPNHNVDIILMDIMMPEMDGYEAISVIRNELKQKNIPILAVTAKAMKGDREKSIQIGANDYVSKPINIDKLTSLMQVWLG